MKVFHCGQCAAQIYFENTVCGACQATLMFVPAELDICATAAPQDPSAQVAYTSALGAPIKPCAQRFSAAPCSWALALDDPQTSCISCRLTRWEQSAPMLDNSARWLLAESAKRRLLFTLLSLHIPFAPKQSDADNNGLAFEWKLPSAGVPVITGHADGLITLDLQETDDAHREATRVAFAEPLRSVLGHLRHEMAHHLQQRFVTTPEQLDSFRALFGDERADYAAALQQHYKAGPPADGAERFISAYASAHPWEDWAETCAHYLLMVDAVQTASAWGLRLDQVPGLATAVVNAPAHVDELVFSQWLPVARFLNAMARTLGSRDSYPFVIPSPVLDKLRFVQRVLNDAAQQTPVNPQPGAVERTIEPFISMPV